MMMMIKVSPPVCVLQVVDVSKRISDVPEWFRGSRLNYAENLLKHTDQEKVALYAAGVCGCVCVGD